MSTSDLARVKAVIEADWKVPGGKSGSSQTSAAKKKPLAQAANKRLIRAVWHFQVKGPTREGKVTQIQKVLAATKIKERTIPIKTAIMERKRYRKLSLS
ncbi:hypothetical protein [Bacillus sp. 0909A]|uniref:hypothetical protein n=1 Tax=Bacillus sp. 0909A TaxID=3120561 RepID=UPI002FDA43C2